MVFKNVSRITMTLTGNMKTASWVMAFKNLPHYIPHDRDINGERRALEERAAFD